MAERESRGGVARYDKIAAFYEDAVGDELDDPVTTALFELLPDLEGRRVLDLACGQGRVSRALARRSANVVGLDVSAALLERARGADAETPLGITYVEDDATSPNALPDKTFELITCHFGLSDIDDLDAGIANVVRWLEPAGTFVFSILHPCFPGWGGDAPSSWPPGKGYYNEGWWRADNSGFRGKVGASHRMLSTYLNTLLRHGLVIDQTAEPRPIGEWIRKNQSEDLAPTYLLARCRNRQDRGR